MRPSSTPRTYRSWLLATTPATEVIWWADAEHACSPPLTPLNTDQPTGDPVTEADTACGHVVPLEAYTTFTNLRTGGMTSRPL